ncbi:MAG: PQQ-binding-like beta-propeller repeat protein [Polyangiaceae bacterium]|nr:PQQ-binding-like beta-propeller repeat protein [Polyangiaceae bacterium]
MLRLDPKDGRLHQAYPVRSPVRAQPVAKGGWIYVGTEDGKLVAIDRKDPTVDGWPVWGGNAARTGTLWLSHSEAGLFVPSRTLYGSDLFRVLQWESDSNARASPPIPSSAMETWKDCAVGLPRTSAGAGSPERRCA